MIPNSCDIKKINEPKKQYYKDNVAKINKRQQQYYQDNKERIKNVYTIYREANKEQIRINNIESRKKAKELKSK